MTRYHNLLLSITRGTWKKNTFHLRAEIGAKGTLHFYNPPNVKQLILELTDNMNWLIVESMPVESLDMGYPDSSVSSMTAHFLISNTHLLPDWWWYTLRLVTKKTHVPTCEIDQQLTILNDKKIVHDVFKPSFHVQCTAWVIRILSHEILSVSKGNYLTEWFPYLTALKMGG